MTMQRRHFELIAAVLREANESVSTPATKRVMAQLTENFATALRSTNANFDRARFERAAGL